MLPKLTAFLAILFYSITATAQAPNKVALIVAVSKYAPGTGWDELSSANDIKLISESLKQQGFKSENIAVITDKQATSAGIQAAIDKQLTSKVKPGDIAVFHFSGHGQQIEDLNGDEGDGLDEALVPYDAPVEFKPGVNKHLSDDVLEKKLTEVRKALGPTGNLLVIVDACHSGTSTRGGGKTRGTTKVYAAPGKSINKQKTIKENFGLAEMTGQLAPMACYFASSPFEQNAEASLPGDVGCGSLSLAFSKALNKMDAKSSYQALFENIKIEMSSLVPQQTPMAEGDLNYPLFSGAVLPKANYYLFTSKDQTLTIPVGTLSGVFEGSTVRVFAQDTRDTANAKPLATGKITSAGTYNSVVSLEQQLPAEQLKTSWVYLHEINYGDLSVKVKIHSKDLKVKASLETILKQIKQVKPAADVADLFIDADGEKFLPNYIYLTTNAGVAIDSIEKIKTDQFANFFAERIGNYARASYLRNMNLKNENYNITFEFVPLKCISGCGTAKAEYVDEDIKTKKDGSGNIIFAVGDRFRINVTNSGNSVAYYTVVDIQPDNIVNVLFPGKGQQAEEFKIYPQSTIPLTKIFRIGPPFGVDVIKVIGSDAPIDLRPMMATRGATTRGTALSPFAKLIQGTYNAEGTKTRGSDEERIQPNAVNIVTIPYKIVSN